MTLEFWGHTLELIGTVMIAYTAIQVHYRVWKEHRIDEKVFMSMRRERRIGVVGIILVVIGYVLSVITLL